MAKFYLYVALFSLSGFVRGRCPVVCVRLRLNMRVLKLAKKRNSATVLSQQWYFR